MICTLSCVLLLFWHNAEMLLTSRIMLSTIDSSLLVGVQPPWQYGFNEIHRPLRWPQTGTWHSGVQWNMHTDGVWCPLLRSRPCFREVLPENHSNLHLDRQLLVVMNIINGIARGGSPCALVPSKSAIEEWTLLRVTCGMCWMHPNVYCCHCLSISYSALGRSTSSPQALAFPYNGLEALYRQAPFHLWK